MATAATSSKKRRKFSGDERDRDHSSCKCDRSESSKRHPKRSHKKAHHRSRGSSLHVKSISELANLVSSGAIRLPKSLIHYEDDRAQLLDQVFTILSPHDIKGMLPDILKDLRTKQIKQLCYEQLKNMSREDIRTAIHREDGSEMETNLDSMLADFLGHDAPKEESRSNEATPQSKSGESSSWHDKYNNETATETDGGKVSSRLNKSWENKASDDAATGTKRSSCHDNRWEKPENKAGNEADTDAKVTDHKMEEFVIRVSDVSDDEREESPLESSRDKRESDEVEDRLELSVRTCGDDIDRELCEDHNKQCSSAESDERERDSGSDNEGSSDLEDYWDDDLEPARLLEMELRKRALESELRRSGKEKQEEEEVVPMVVEEKNIDKGTLLELNLRQRALQSLLAKKKTDT